MSLALSSKATRELESALRDAIDGKQQAVIDRLAKLLGHLMVPDVRKRNRDEAATLRLKVERLERELRHAKLFPPVAADANATVGKTVTPLPKPPRRVVDRELVAEFRATHTRCAVLGCPNGDADPHHIWPRGRGGPDETFNLMPLCPGPLGHHEEIERIDAEAFAARYASRLPHVYLLRIKHALAAEAEKKLGEREAIDLDADVEGLQ